jgi:hypothetical protein
MKQNQKYFRVHVYLLFLDDRIYLSWASPVFVVLFKTGMLAQGPKHVWMPQGFYSACIQFNGSTLFRLTFELSDMSLFVLDIVMSVQYGTAGRMYRLLN